MVTKVTREGLPQFSGHEEAKAYFEKTYGASNFELVEKLVDHSEGTFYLYKLIVDPEAYEKGQEEIKQKGYCASEAFIQSTQRIKIMEDGAVHL
jgi:hypothetical protein